ncbi:30S ribosomal protein S3 [Candidatus Woesearchaeota archaeon CG10_big_fil_rev_8_21_14_0_10_44_13]|nr:MAG: 30S ribosomal protein S3 [Candidatus Woesearchaeota archaeon CG10_big_fil_rev_8_21_14_0_10_44_13]
MIERKIVAEKIKEYQIEEYISGNLKNSGHSHTKVQRTPLGEKVVIFASRPGLIVGRKGQNIKKLTSDLKNKFNLENPQLEISEVGDVNLDSQIVAERIAASLERYGSSNFKGIAHKVMQDVMGAGAFGIEIVINGKIPSTRAKSWRFYKGYLKKCGDIALTGINKSHASANLKSGVVGVKVSIMPPTTKLPDDMEVSDEAINVIEEKPLEEEIKKKAKKPRKKEAKKEEDKKDHKKEEPKKEEIATEDAGEAVSEAAPDEKKTE